MKAATCIKVKNGEKNPCYVNGYFCQGKGHFLSPGRGGREGGEGRGD